MLARDLLREAPSSHEIVPRTSKQLDVTDVAALRAAIRAVRPAIVINAAAYTDVDRAEGNQARAFAVNAMAPGRIGQLAEVAGSMVVHFSTDYVFDGSAREPYRETDPTSPVGVYGASKLRGEQALAESGAAFLIVRTQWLFGFNGASFPRTMWNRALSRHRTKVVDDQIGRPTYTLDLARATWTLLGQVLQGSREAGHSGPGMGIVHVANEGIATWYDVAKRVFDAAGASSLLEPCSTTEYPTPARRPAWSVLSTARYRELTGENLHHWDNAVDRFLAELQGERALSRIRE